MDITEQLYECLEYAEDLETLLDTKESYQNRLVSLDYDLQRSVQRHKTYKNIAVITLVVCLFISVIFGISVAAVTDIGLFAVPVVFVVPIVFFLLAAKQKKLLRVMSQTCKTESANVEKKIADASVAINELVKEIHQRGLTEIIPLDYFTPPEINYCIEVLRKRLANTVQEALILLNKHIERMESQALQEERAMRQEQQMADLIRAVEINTMATVINEINRKNNY